MERGLKGIAVSGMLLILLFFSMLPMVFLIQPARGEPGTIYIRADGSIEGTTNITSVDNVIYTFTDNNNDEIVVERDNIVVDGAGYTVQGTGTGIGISLWNRNNVTLKNIQASNFDVGIYLYNSSNNTLSNNTASNNDDHGIFLDRSSSNVLTDNTVSNNNYEGIWLYLSSYNNLTGNAASNHNYDGILLYNSSSNVLTGNTVSNSTIGDGIRLYHSSYNNLTGNTASNNYYEGIRLYDSSDNNTVIGNTLSNNDNNGILLVSSSGNVFTSNNFSNNDFGIFLIDFSNNNNLAGNNASNSRWCGIYLDSSSGNVLTDNTASNSPRGIWLTNSSKNNLLTGNTASNNDHGIYLYNSSSNVLTGNTASNNLGYGIWLGNSGNNTIFHNNFINNPFQAHVTAGYVKTWNDGYPSGGNYWSNYGGADLYGGPHQNLTGSDGIGDTPHVIDANNTDSYPLMSPYPSLHAISLEGETLKTVLAQGFSTKLYAEVANGHFTETFNVTAYANSTVVDTFTNITLTIGGSTSLTFTWNATSLAKGNYHLSLYATPVPGEVFTEDNMYTCWVLITIVGDVDGDRDVDVGDQRKVQVAMFSEPGAPNWNPNMDVDCDLDVDVGDQRKQQIHMFESW